MEGMRRAIFLGNVGIQRRDRVFGLRVDTAKFMTQTPRMSSATKSGFVKDAWQTPRNRRTFRAYMALQNSEIGARLRELRKQRGNPPQQTVAERVGVSYRSLQAWEAGETKPNYGSLQKLAVYYGVSEEHILMGGADLAPVEPVDQDQLDRIEQKLDRQYAMLSQLLTKLTTDEAISAMEEGARVLEELAQTQPTGRGESAGTRRASGRRRKSA